MPDQSFFKRQGPLKLKDIAAATGADLSAGSDGNYVLEDVAPLGTAGPKDLSFLDNIKYKQEFLTTKAGACFIARGLEASAPKGLHLLISAHPYKSYALAAQKFYPAPAAVQDISKNAVIASSAKIGKGCRIEPGVVVGENAVIGDHNWLEPNVVIGPSVKIGTNCHIGANATISHAHVGDYVRVYPGVRIGQDGFGFAIDPKGHVKVPQLGRVIIEDHVEIGANTTIDRGAGPDTVIGQGTWIDNLVQIAHNVKIGRGCIIVAQVGISGSTAIEDFVAIGGQAGITGHLNIGKGAQIAAQSGVMRDIPAGEKYMGSPAMPAKEALKQYAYLNRLIKKDKTS
jgi:UDP-3-O-[3-hydroxymyristoyl] glucosamine N-acyltransferase